MLTLDSNYQDVIDAYNEEGACSEDDVLNHLSSSLSKNTTWREVCNSVESSKTRKDEFCAWAFRAMYHRIDQEARLRLLDLIKDKDYLDTFSKEHAHLFSQEEEQFTRSKRSVMPCRY